MQKLLIEGGHELSGEVHISGAKNSAVALLPAAILADSTVTIEGLPDISDVDTLGQLLEEIGGTVSRDGRYDDPSRENDCHAIAERKSQKITCILLFHGCHAWKI